MDDTFHNSAELSNQRKRSEVMETRFRMSAHDCQPHCQHDRQHGSSCSPISAKPTLDPCCHFQPPSFVRPRPQLSFDSLFCAAEAGVARTLLSDSHGGVQQSVARNAMTLLDVVAACPR